ncbi:MULTISPECIES: galactokinase [unclassified Meiothermus]|uniref:galactokinase n=1 Tax=unclassified Meiothermus TaxID=370471 RepID=UPI000D7C141B|nr:MULTISPECIES: galactokinase [unclassified Meiothermus]PZA07867.1 galactokinase [Meiothermus sp. Pnk-1]RYM38828.1 galactokinase [Meiothermus sp. PNK-Is4]
MDFKDRFGTPPEASAQAPGRVNLLGEHTDYNDGFVLPTPLPYFTYVEVGALEGRIEGYAENFGETRSRSLEEGRQGDWLDYLAGCVWVLHKAGHRIPGGRFYVRSEVPMGAGLSSSAALEVATLRALRALYRLPLDDKQIARLAQQAEAEYVGVRVGIMDQMASSLGQPGEALFLDTRTLAHQLVPLPRGYKVAVVDSAVPRRLAEAGYNERRSQCEEAARLLGVKALRDVGLDRMDQIEALPPPLDRRARHVVTENTRVLEGVRALEQGDIERLGELMLASHRSLRDDYEVSIPELDQLVELAMQNGAVGARLTGAGFGGAIVALVPEQEYERFKAGVTRGYPQARFV